MRSNKGKRWNKHFDDYTVIDVETCGLFGEERNCIIELSAIRVRNGIVVDEYSSLVNPMQHISRKVTEITGIDNIMVDKAPVLRDVLGIFLDFIGNDIIVGYNINTYDYNILYDLSSKLFHREFSNDFVDVLYAAKYSIKNIDNYKLTTVCDKNNIDYTGAHRALKDCYLTKSVYDFINEMYGQEVFDGKSHSICERKSSRRKPIQYTAETQQLRELQSILLEIIEDNEVSENEVILLSDWMNNNSQLRGNYPYDRVFDLLEVVLEDGVIDAEELQLLLDKFTEYTTPSKSTCNGVENLTDKHFVLTGEFNYGSRTEVSEYIISKGGIIDDNVKKCTQYVVIGSLGSQAWKNGVYGSKIKKAIELKDKGQQIELVSEDDFFSSER